MRYVIRNIDTGEQWMPGIGWQPAGPGFGSWAMASKAANTLAGCGEPARIDEADVEPWDGTITAFCAPALPQNAPPRRRTPEPVSVEELPEPSRPRNGVWELTEEGCEVHYKTKAPRAMRPDPVTGEVRAMGCLGFLFWLIWSPFFNIRPPK